MYLKRSYAAHKKTFLSMSLTVIMRFSMITD